jgi:glucose-1-phosphate thymidylyltransferase
MKLIIPMGGLGTRLYPHTYNRPKPLVSVAGKPVLAHILGQLEGLEIEEVIFVVGRHGEQVKHYMAEVYPQYRTKFIEQKALLGQSHAVYLAKEAVQGELLIIFPDTLFETDLTSLASTTGDGVLHLMEVADPARFGVAVVNRQGWVTRLVEKPRQPVSNLAVVGVYYFKQAEQLFTAIEKQIAAGSGTIGGEFYLADAFSIMLAEGCRLQARQLAWWEDCGTIEALLHANRTLLSLQPPPQTIQLDLIESLVIPPVYIAPDARIIRSVIGPYASIEAGSLISDAIVRDSILGEGSRVVRLLLENCVVGNRAQLSGAFQCLNLGDDSQFKASESPGWHD